MARTFQGAALSSIVLTEAQLAEGEMETISLDGVLPPGSENDYFAPGSSAPPIRSPLTPEQRKLRMQLATLKLAFEDFEIVSPLSRLDISDLKRGDVVVIKTIVGGLYWRVIDRITGEKEGAGEILCECHYELGEQSCSAHAASIQLPVCTSSHTVVNPDGTKRLASRKLKMTTETQRPPHVINLLQESFFVEIALHVNPQVEQRRLLDFGRWIARIWNKVQAVIDENNRREREKKQKKEAARRQKIEDREQKNEEKRRKAEAGKMDRSG